MAVGAAVAGPPAVTAAVVAAAALASPLQHSVGRLGVPRWWWAAAVAGTLCATAATRG